MPARRRTEGHSGPNAYAISRTWYGLEISFDRRFSGDRRPFRRLPGSAHRTHVAPENRVARNPGHAKMADVLFKTSARLPSILSGGGGGIRTRDLWVMSPTSCRCSTPRQNGAHLLSRRGGVRSGLASHGVAPAVLSGAALGHDRVRDGSGWSQNALGHGHRPASQEQVRACMVRSRVATRVRTGRVRRGQEESTLGHEHESAPVGYPPSTPRLATGSSARGLSSFERGASSGSGIPA